MPKVFLTYFDILGYKEFILNNENEEVYRRELHILRDIENALSDGEMAERQPNGLIYADLSDYRINALNISDTILFWSNDTSCDSFIAMCKASYRFNWLMNLNNFPVRGCFYCGELNFLSWNMKNENGGKYLGSPLYGKAVVEAHLKADSMNWAGCVIDETVLQQISTQQCDDTLIKEKTILTLVPYKKSTENQSEEFVFMMSKGQLNDEALKNWKIKILDTFKRDNKPTDSDSVQLKIKNTINFIELHSENIKNEK